MFSFLIGKIELNSYHSEYVITALSLKVYSSPTQTLTRTNVAVRGHTI